MNAWKHGERSAEAVARRRELWALYRLVRALACTRRRGVA
jgi:hypothetical protein